MNITAYTARQSLSYVFNAAVAGPPASSTTGASTDDGAVASASTGAVPSQSATNAPPVADRGSTNGQSAVQSGGPNGDQQYSLLDYIKDPTSITYHRLTLNPSVGRPASAAEIAASKAQVDAAHAWETRMGVTQPDPNAPLYVRDASSYPSDRVPYEYLLMRSAVANRQAAGQTVTMIGPNGTTVDPAEYLESLKQSAIAALEAQGSVDKSA